jgi:hypothetical protein
MRLRRNDQFDRISHGLEFGKSEEALGGRIPAVDRAISVDPDNCRHSRCPFERFMRRQRLDRRPPVDRLRRPAAFILDQARDAAYWLILPLTSRAAASRRKACCPKSPSGFQNSAFPGILLTV